MTVSNLSYADDVVIPLALIRPRMTVWTSGVGPHDLQGQWDTVPTFDGVDLMTDTDTSISNETFHSLVPPSDMGGIGTTWFARVKGTDLGLAQNEIQRVRIGEVSATPTASASHTSSTFVAANTIDGSTITEWRSGVSGTAAVIYLEYDFGSAVTINRIELLQSHGDWADSLEVFWSDDGSAWTSAGSPAAAVQGWNDLVFTGGTHRYWRIQENSSRNAWWRVQLVLFFGSATGGTFRLDFDGDQTGDLAFDISTAALATALEALTGITDVTVTGTVSLVYTIEFVDPGSTNVPILTVAVNSLTPTGDVLIETVQQGVDGISYSDTIELDWYDPIDDDRFLYQYRNVYPSFEPLYGTDWGSDVGGTDHTDGESHTFDRFLYQLRNVHPSFDPLYGTDWGAAYGGEPTDGLSRSKPRFKYQLWNITTDLPVPILFRLDPNFGRVGEAFLIVGHGLKPYEAYSDGKTYTESGGTSGQRLTDTFLMAEPDQFDEVGYYDYGNNARTITVDLEATLAFNEIQIWYNPADKFSTVTIDGSTNGSDWTNIVTAQAAGSYGTDVLELWSAQQQWSYRYVRFAFVATQSLRQLRIGQRHTIHDGDVEARLNDTDTDWLLSVSQHFNTNIAAQVPDTEEPGGLVRVETDLN